MSKKVMVTTFIVSRYFKLKKKQYLKTITDKEYMELEKYYNTLFFSLTNDEFKLFANVMYVLATSEVDTITDDMILKVFKDIGIQIVKGE